MEGFHVLSIIIPMEVLLMTVVSHIEAVQILRKLFASLPDSRSSAIVLTSVDVHTDANLVVHTSFHRFPNHGPKAVSKRLRTKSSPDSLTKGFDAAGDLGDPVYSTTASSSNGGQALMLASRPQMGPLGGYDDADAPMPEESDDSDHSE